MNNADRKRATYQSRQSSGVCTQCGINPPAASGATCETCRAKKRNEYSNRIAACSDWLAAKEQRRQHHHALLNVAGFCAFCHVSLAPTTEFEVSRNLKPNMCDVCYFKRIRRKRGYSASWQELQDLFRKQDGKCCYTGERLVLGENASLDHKLPRTRGGSNTIDNLQWVTLRTNYCKNDCTHDELLAWCRQVLAYDRCDAV